MRALSDAILRKTRGVRQPGGARKRGDDETRRAYTQGIREVLLEISARMELPASRSDERALQILTVLVGGMTLARGLDDVELLPGDEVRYRFPHIAPTVLQARYRARDG